MTSYVYNFKNNKEEKALSDIVSIGDWNEDFTELLYTVKSDKKIDISQYIEDDMLESDNNFVEYTYDDYLDDVIDYKTYKNNIKEKNYIDDRNDIREQIKEYDGYQLYDVYSLKNNKKTLVVEGISGYYYENIDNKRIVYSEVSFNISEKLKMSDISYFSTFSNYLYQNAKYNIYFKIFGKDACELYGGDESIYTVYVSDNDIYYTIDGELFYTEIKGNKLETTISIDENVEIGEITDDGLLYIANLNDDEVGEMKIAKGKNVTLISENVVEDAEYIIGNNGNIYYFTGEEFGLNLELNVYNGSKSKKLYDEVGEIVYENDKYMYIYKDCSESAETCDLYRYNGKKLELIDYSVDVDF